MLKSYCFCFVFCCLFVLSCFLGIIIFIFYLLGPGPWFGPIGSSWPVLCHGWHWGVALYWCGEISFCLFLFHFFFHRLQDITHLFEKKYVTAYFFFCLPFYSWLTTLYPLFWVTNNSPWMVLLRSLLFWDILSVILENPECVVNRPLLDMLLTLWYSILMPLDVLGNII